MTESRVVEQLLGDLEEEWSQNVRDAIHALSAIGTKTLPILLRKLKNPSKNLWHNGMILLRELSPTDQFPALLELFEEKFLTPEQKKELAQIIIILLKNFSVEEWSEEIKQFLTQLSEIPDQKLKLEAIQYWKKLPWKEAWKELNKLARDPDISVSNEAKKSLEELAFAKENEIFTEELLFHEESDKKVKYSLIKKLRYYFEPQKLLDIYQKLVNSPKIEEEVKIEILNQISQLPETSIQNIREKFLSEHIIKFINHPLLEVRQTAAKLLSQFITPEDRQLLRPLLETLHNLPYDPTRRELLKAFDTLLSSFPSPQFILPELLSAVEKSEGESLEFGIQLLVKYMPRESSTLYAEKILNLISSKELGESHPELIELLKEIFPPDPPDSLKEKLLQISIKYSHSSISKEFLELIFKKISKETSEKILLKLAEKFQTFHFETQKKLKQYLKEMAESFEKSESLDGEEKKKVKEMLEVKQKPPAEYIPKEGHSWPELKKVKKTPPKVNRPTPPSLPALRAFEIKRKIFSSTK